MLGLDVGDVRVGVARTDELGFAAHPVGVFTRGTLEADLQHVVGLIAEHEASRVVVGLPLRMDGTDSPQTAKVRAFAEALGAAVPVPVELADERLTTVQAEEMLRQAGVKSRKRRKRVDAMAAQVILQDWLSEQEPGR